MLHGCCWAWPSCSDQGGGEDDGLSTGQYRLESGELVTEQSKIIVLLHDGSEASSADIDTITIREEYKSQFDQESVLRIDSQPCVAF